jgi:hypothetical protein
MLASRNGDARQQLRARTFHVGGGAVCCVFSTIMERAAGGDVEYSAVRRTPKSFPGEASWCFLKVVPGPSALHLLPSYGTVASKWPAKQGPFPFLWRTAFTSTAATIAICLGHSIRNSSHRLAPDLLKPCPRAAIREIGGVRPQNLLVTPWSSHAESSRSCACRLWLAVAFIPRSENPESRSVDATPHWPLF